MPNPHDLEKNLPISYRQLEELTNALEQFQELIAPHVRQDENAEQAWGRLERAVWGLQTHPLASLAKKFEEVALELAAQQKKQVHFEAIGFDLDVSEPVRQAVDTALLHAIRNAIDHGIETPSERLSAGKPALSRIRATVVLEQGVMKLVISDDGRGPDLERIGQKIAERGLATASRVEQLSATQKLSYVFNPGFSTRERPSAISGRGVGLDAVKSAFDQLSGAVQARIGTRGGFELEGTLIPEVLGLDAVPAWIGKNSFWLQAGGFEVVQGKVGAEEAAAAKKLATQSGWELQDSVLHLRVKSRTAGAFLLAVNQVGVPQYKLFRPLDAIWKTTGPKWLKLWISACRGSGLASRTAQGAESTARAPGVAILADPGMLLKLMNG